MHTFICASCGRPFSPDNESRFLWGTRDADLLVSRRGLLNDHTPQAAEDAAPACGQTCTLILTERFVERGTFAPAHADHFAHL